MGEYNCGVGQDLLWVSTTLGWEGTFNECVQLWGGREPSMGEYNSGTGPSMGEYNCGVGEDLLWMDTPLGSESTPLGGREPSTGEYNSGVGEYTSEEDLISE